MRVNVYSTLLNEERIPYLVKERGFNYQNALTTPCEISNMMINVFNMGRLPQEHIYLLCLDSKCKVNGVFLLSIGSIDAAFADVPSIFQKALLCNAHNIILVHNHPSGDSTPSVQDKNVTSRVKEVGKLMEIQLLDHIIIGGNSYTSLREEGIM